MKYILCNILLIVLFGITLVNLYRNNIKVSHADFFLVIFAFIYLGCTSLLSANPRQFYIISPILFYFIGRYIFKGPSIIEKTKLKPFRYWLKQ